MGGWRALSALVDIRSVARIDAAVRRARDSIDTVMTDSESRRARIRHKLEAGELPSSEPDGGLRLSSLLAMGATRQGVSEGTICSGCDDPIKAGETMVDYSYQSGRVVCFHEECERFWKEARFSRGG